MDVWYSRLLLLLGFLLMTACWTLGLAVLPAWSATYYVSPPNGTPAGNDNNPCQSLTPTTRRATINGGAACLSGGDTLIVGDGTYSEQLMNVIPSGVNPIDSYSAQNPTVIKSENRHGAIITGMPNNTPGIVIGQDGFGNRGDVRDYITIDGFIFDIPRNVGSFAFSAHGGNQQPPYAVPGDGATGIQLLNNEVRGGANTCSVSFFTVGFSQGANHHHWTISGNTIHDIGMTPYPGTVDLSCFSNPAGTVAWSYSMYISGADNIIENNEIYLISGFAFHGYSNNNYFHRNIFRNNFIHDTGGAVLLACAGHDNQIYNNILARTGSFIYPNGPNSSNWGGITIGGSACNFSSDNNYIYNNTIVGAHGGGATGCIALSFNPGGVAASNNVVRNNICYQNVNGCSNANTGCTPDDSIHNSSTGSGNTIDTNFCTGTGCTTYGDPQFVNLSGQLNRASDFQLQSGSPARDHGVATSSGTPKFTTDFGGNARIANGVQDQGAWEFDSQQQPPTHLACSTGGTCARVSGSAQDSCSPEFAACTPPVTPFPFTALHWRLDECSPATTVQDASNNNVIGTFSTGTYVPAWIPGHDGAPHCALSLVDNASTVSNSAATWAAGKPVSVTFWIRTHSPLCSGGGCGTFSVGNQDYPNRFEANVPWGDANNTLYWVYGDQPNGVLGYPFTAYLGKWTFVALVSDGATFKAIYLNAIKVAEGATASAPTQTLTGVTLGAFTPPSHGWYANADLDDFQITNRVLSQVEIQQMYGQARRTARHGRLELK